MDHTENTLRGVIKALTDVIAPAIDPTDALAKEQLRLSVDYLQFVRARLDALYERERFELRHALAMARSLAALEASSGAGLFTNLSAKIAAGAAAYDEAGVPIPTLRAATAALAAAVRTLVREAAGFDETLRGQIERVVLEATDERVAFERAWYLPLGFDPSPSEVPPLAEALGRRSASRGDRASLSGSGSEVSAPARP